MKKLEAAPQATNATKGSLARRFAGAMLFAAIVPTASFAAPVTVVAGDIIKLYDGPGNTGGGEFWADVFQSNGTTQKGVSGTITQTNNDFIAFCLEYNETFSYGQPLKVQAISTAAVNGGLSGGNPDPISNQTAWLYSNFANNTLTGYTHTTAKANSLQRAIWYLEGEMPTVTSISALNSIDSQAATWVNAAYAAGPTSIGNVRVLNLMKKDSHGNYTVNAQDQLYIMPVPEPETYAMLLAGLGLMGFVARRRRQTRAV